MKIVSLVPVLLVFLLSHTRLIAQEGERILRNDFEKFYRAFDVTGGIIIFDEQQNNYLVYNKELVDKRLPPASTFKIVNSLIALETGAIGDENEVIRWDSVQRSFPGWNSDNNLTTAYKYSVVWFYQELARRTGPKQMRHWIDKVNYGNNDLSGGIDKFWLTGGLRISPAEQVKMLVRLNHSELPFSPKTIETVKKIMIAKETPDYTLRAKTGWRDEDARDIGWYVGYVVRGDKTYYFANCIMSPPENKNFAKARIEIVLNILKELKIIEE